MGRQALAACPASATPALARRLAAGQAREPAARRRWGRQRVVRSRWRAAARARAPPPSRPGRRKSFPDAGRRRAASPRRRIALAAAALLAACAVVALALAVGGDEEKGRGQQCARGRPGRVEEIVGEPIPVGDSPADVAVGEGAVWVANEGGETVTRIDPSTRTAGQPIQVGEDPRALAVGAGSVWVANFGDGTVTRIDPRSRRAFGLSASGAGPPTSWSARPLSGSPRRRRA